MLIFKLILNLVLIQDPPPGAWHDRGRDCVDTEAHALTAFYPSVTQVFCMNQTKPKDFCISVNQTKHEPHSRRYNPQSFVSAHWWFFGPTKRKNWLFTLDWVNHWSFGPTKSSIFPHSDSPSLLCEQWIQILNCGGLLGCQVFCTTSINDRSQYVALIILYPCCLLMFCSHFDTWSKWLKCSCAPLENCGKNLQYAIYDVYPQYAMHIMQNASCKGPILTLCQHMNIYEICSDNFPIMQKSSAPPRSFNWTQSILQMFQLAHTKTKLYAQSGICKLQMNMHQSIVTQSIIWNSWQSLLYVWANNNNNIWGSS